MSNKLLQSVTKTRDKLSSKEKLLFKAVTAVIQTLHGKIIDYLSENYPKQTMPQWVDNFSYIDLLFKDNKYFILIFIEKCQFPEKAFEINESFFEDSFIVKEFNKAITKYDDIQKVLIGEKILLIMKNMTRHNLINWSITDNQLCHTCKIFDIVAEIRLDIAGKFWICVNDISHSIRFDNIEDAKTYAETLINAELEKMLKELMAELSKITNNQVGV